MTHVLEMNAKTRTIKSMNKHLDAMESAAKKDVPHPGSLYYIQAINEMRKEIARLNRLNK